MQQNGTADACDRRFGNGRYLPNGRCTKKNQNDKIAAQLTPVLSRFWRAFQALARSQHHSANEQGARMKSDTRRAGARALLAGAALIAIGVLPAHAQTALQQTLEQQNLQTFKDQGTLDAEETQYNDGVQNALSGLSVDQKTAAQSAAVQGVVSAYNNYTAASSAIDTYMAGPHGQNFHNDPKYIQLNNDLTAAQTALVAAAGTAGLQIDPKTKELTPSSIQTLAAASQIQSLKTQLNQTLQTQQQTVNVDNGNAHQTVLQMEKPSSPSSPSLSPAPQFTIQRNTRPSLDLIPSISFTPTAGQSELATAEYKLNELAETGKITWSAATAAINYLVGPSGGTLVGPSGGTLTINGSKVVSNDGGSLLALAALVASGGGNIVSQGGGNLVATGGGNFGAATSALISNDGATLQAQAAQAQYDAVAAAYNAGKITDTEAESLNAVVKAGGNIVASGGGNLVFSSVGLAALASGLKQGGNYIGQGGNTALVASGGGNIVAQGGGNIVAQGGGNLANTLAPALALISQDGGSLISQDGGSLVASGGGNLVASGGGNIVASGAGNFAGATGAAIVASGAGNLTAVLSTAMTQAGISQLVASGAGNIISSSSPLVALGGNGIGQIGNALQGGAIPNADPVYGLESLGASPRPLATPPAGPSLASSSPNQPGIAGTNQPVGRLGASQQLASTQSSASPSPTVANPSATATPSGSANASSANATQIVSLQQILASDLAQITTANQNGNPGLAAQMQPTIDALKAKIAALQLQNIVSTSGPSLGPTSPPAAATGPSASSGPIIATGMGATAEQVATLGTLLVGNSTAITTTIDPSKPYAGLTAGQILSMLSGNLSRTDQNALSGVLSKLQNGSLSQADLNNSAFQTAYRDLMTSVPTAQQGTVMQGIVQSASTNTQVKTVLTAIAPGTAPAAPGAAKATATAATSPATSPANGTETSTEKSKAEKAEIELKGKQSSLESGRSTSKGSPPSDHRHNEAVANQRGTPSQQHMQRTVNGPPGGRPLGVTAAAASKSAPPPPPRALTPPPPPPRTCAGKPC